MKQQMEERWTGEHKAKWSTLKERFRWLYPFFELLFAFYWSPFSTLRLLPLTISARHQQCLPVTTSASHTKALFWGRRCWVALYVLRGVDDTVSWTPSRVTQYLESRILKTLHVSFISVYIYILYLWEMRWSTCEWLRPCAWSPSM